MVLTLVALLSFTNLMTTKSEISAISLERKLTSFNISYLKNKVIEDELKSPIVAGDVNIHEFLRGIEKEDEEWSAGSYSFDQIEGNVIFKKDFGPSRGAANIN